MTKIEREKLNELLGKLLVETDPGSQALLFTHLWRLFRTLGNQIIWTDEGLMAVTSKGTK